MSILAIAVATACGSDGHKSAPSGAGGAVASGGASSGGTSGGGASGGTGGAPSSGGIAGTGGAPGGGAPGSGGVAQGDAGTGPLVTVTGGVLRGVSAGKTDIFRNIPFAAPPVGDLRFALPAPPAAWTGERDASAFGAACPQNGPANPKIRESEAEDCLTLNVFTPASGAANAPVMVFFFGGNFNVGTSSLYDGQKLSEAGGVVVVTVNYRLGALGFMAHPALDTALGVPSGNLGIRDQQQALRWVRDEIAAFGGDSGNVTVFGESAGAIAACLHAFATESRSLAHKFILESGGCLSVPVATMKRSTIEWLSGKLVADLCKDDPDTLACLRKLPADTLAKWTDTTTDTDPGTDPLAQQFYPQMDGVVFTDYPKRLAQTGDFNHGPVLLGTTENEAEFYRTVDVKQVNTAVNLGFYLLATYPTTWQAMFPFYTPASDAEANAAWDRLTTDTWFRCPTRATARAFAGGGNSVYLYSFALRPAVHTQELDYVFGYPVTGDELTSPPLPSGAAPNPPVPALVDVVQTYWTSFARNGIPARDGSPEWPEYDAASDRHLVLNEPVSTGSALAKPQCDAWDTANAGAPN